MLETAENADPTKPKVLMGSQINAYDILPKNLAYWHYRGSLTTPPCQKKIGSHVKVRVGCVCVCVCVCVCSVCVCVRFAVLVTPVMCVAGTRPVCGRFQEELRGRLLAWLGLRLPPTLQSVLLTLSLLISTHTHAHVQWFVFKTPSQLSYNQLFFFTSYFEQLPLANNGQVNRNIQKVHEETVIYEYN